MGGELPLDSALNITLFICILRCCRVHVAHLKWARVLDSVPAARAAERCSEPVPRRNSEPLLHPAAEAQDLSRRFHCGNRAMPRWLALLVTLAARLLIGRSRSPLTTSLSNRIVVGILTGINSATQSSKLLLPRLSRLPAWLPCQRRVGWFTSGNCRTGDNLVVTRFMLSSPQNETPWGIRRCS